jgi:type IV secretion system protein VirB9
MRLTLLAFALACAAPATAATAQALSGDERVVNQPYNAGEVVPLRSAAGGFLSIVFAPGERITNVEIGDPEAVDVSLSGNTDGLLLRTLRAPTDPRISVRTDLRSYTFALTAGAPAAATYLLRFSYGPVQMELAAASTPPSAPAAPYRLTGTRELRPATVSDDGVHTYLTWAPDQALPAVFAINTLGDEEIVDGYMRDDVFTIDRVYAELVFRIGKKTAKARRGTNEGRP